MAAFFGGGVAGNLTQFCFYIFQKIRWETVLPSPNSWGLLGDFLGNKADILQKFALDKAFTSIHGTTSCKGASAAICSIVAIETCANIVSLYDKYIELRRRRRLGIADREWDNQMTQEMMYEVCHLGLVIIVLLSDLVPLLDSTTPGKGIISTFVAYSADGIGHAAHMGGFIFGVLYYLIALSGHRTPGNNR